MPRMSAAAYAVPTLAGMPTRLEAPASLSPAEVKIFSELRDSVARTHFRACDVPLLIAYVRAIYFENYAAAALAKDPADTKAMALWEKSSRAMVALSARLRLAPQSRATSRAAGREKPAVEGPRPWE